MAKLVTGVEIGSYHIKFAVCNQGNITQLVIEPVPDNLIREGTIVSWEAMADVMKEVIGKHKLTCKQAAIVLPENQMYLRRLTMPLMTVDQLKVNLPYEFHDYISEDIDKYFFDYAVIDMIKNEEGEVKQMDLLAAAVKKTTIDQYKTLFRRAGMKLIAAEPVASVYGKAIRAYRIAHGIIGDTSEGNTGDDDYGILDLGHSSIRIDIYSQGVYDTTRILEIGCDAITDTISELYHVDRHIAEVYKQTNQDNVWEHEACINTYNNIAIEVMRVMNFYNFNHPDNSLDKLYYCGGGAHITPLLREISHMIEPELVGIEELYSKEAGNAEELRAAPAAVAITME